MLIYEPGEAELAITVPEAARRLHISATTCYRLVREGKLPAVRLGSRVLVPVEPLRKLFGGGEAKAE